MTRKNDNASETERMIFRNKKEQMMLEKHILIIITNMKQNCKKKTVKYAKCQILTKYTMVYKFIISFTQIQTQHDCNGTTRYYN